MKSFLRVERTQLLLPVCAAAVLCIAGCAEQAELPPMPVGAFVPEYNAAAIPANNASPAPGIGVQGPAGSSSVGGTMNMDDILDIQPAAAPASDKNAPKAPASSAADVSTQKTAAAAAVVYKVSKGDTLSSIARRYNTTWRAIAEYNKIDNKGRIFVGQTLRIPAPDAKKAEPAKKTDAKNKKTALDSGKVHVVTKGEFPGKIAAMYKVKLADLLALNKLDGKKNIYPGQKLRIPKAAAAEKTVAKKAAKKSAAKKPVAKKTAKKNTAQKSQKKSSVVPVISPAQKKNTGDDVLNDIDSNDSAAKPAAKSTSNAVKVAAPAKENVLSLDTQTVPVTLDKDMTLEQVARAYDRSVEALKKHNPNLSSEEVLKASTVVIVPIF